MPGTEAVASSWVEPSAVPTVMAAGAVQVTVGVTWVTVMVVVAVADA